MIKAVWKLLRDIGGAIAAIALGINAVTGAMHSVGIILSFGKFELPNIWLILISTLLTLILIAVAFYAGGVYIMYCIMMVVARLFRPRTDEEKARMIQTINDAFKADKP